MLKYTCMIKSTLANVLKIWDNAIVCANNGCIREIMPNCVLLSSSKRANYSSEYRSWDRVGDLLLKYIHDSANSELTRLDWPPEDVGVSYLIICLITVDATSPIHHWCSVMRTAAAPMLCHTGISAATLETRMLRFLEKRSDKSSTRLQAKLC